MAKAAIAALESVYAAGAQTPCYRYDKEPAAAYASSPRLRQGAVAGGCPRAEATGAVAGGCPRLRSLAWP